MGHRKINRPFKRVLRDIWESFYDHCRYTLVSLWELFCRPKYLIGFIVSLLFFLYFLTFFRDGNGNWQLVWSGLDFGRKMEMLGRVWLAVGANFTSWYGLAIVLISVLQAIVIIQLIFAWRHRQKNQVIDGVSTGGIGAIFGFIALGCPTCGVGLLTPILTAVAGAGAMALAETFSNVFTILALLLLFYTVLKLGYNNFVTISAAAANKTKEEKHATGN